MKIVMLLMCLTSAVAHVAGTGVGSVSQAPRLQPAGPYVEKTFAATRPADPQMTRLAAADRADQCNQQARLQDLQGDDYRLFVIRCMSGSR